jgi:hypothetical protein
MLLPDVPVWYDFLDQYKDRFLNVYYNCLLGGPLIPDEDPSDPDQRLLRHVMSKRADAICELEKEIWIIEVVANPGLRSVGQVISYLFLWNEDPKSKKRPVAGLVCRTLDHDLSRIMLHHNVLVFKV